MAKNMGMEEKQITCILIAPGRIAAEDRLDPFLTLCHPTSGQSTCYLFADEKLLEFHRFKLPYGSWFLGDYVCKDGCLYMATPVDPVFIMLPILEGARMKVHQLKRTLANLDKNFAARSEKETLADAVAIMREYLSEEPWIKHLCDHLNLNLLAEFGQTASAEKVHAASGIDGSGRLPGFQSKVDKRTAKGGKQYKKVKPETDSWNIREMFTRASRKSS